MELYQWKLIIVEFKLNFVNAVNITIKLVSKVLSMFSTWLQQNDNMLVLFKQKD